MASLSVPRFSPRIWSALICPISIAAVLGSPPAEATTEIPVGDVGTALHNFALSPDAVAGADDWECKPSRRHPRPVVLVHATFLNKGATWPVLSPMLANDGYCVFAFNYGMNHLSLGRIGGIGDIARSAGTMRSFVDRVLASTGARQVDVVGHSQGGMLPHYYIKRLGGAAKVHTFAALSPSNHGTTLSGVFSLTEGLGVLGLLNTALNVAGLPGVVQQQKTSRFQKALFAGGDTVRGPRYVVVQTRNDLVVTPYTTAFLKGPRVRNVLVQDLCPKDPVGHIGMLADGPALQIVMDALGPAEPGFRPECRNYGLPV